MKATHWRALECSAVRTIRTPYQPGQSLFSVGMVNRHTLNDLKTARLVVPVGSDSTGRTLYRLSPLGATLLRARRDIRRAHL